LVLGRTPLVERQRGRFVVRHQAEIGRLLARAYGREHEPAARRLMSGLTTVAAALNANDHCLARIAAVHLKIRDLPDAGTRHALEVEDALLKSTDWNPDLHPRGGGATKSGLVRAYRRIK
jgi:hypothetical protein